MSKVLFNVNHNTTVELIDNWEKEIAKRWEKYNHKNYSMVDSIIELIKSNTKKKEGKLFYTDQMHTIIDRFGDCFGVGMAHGIKPYFIIDEKDLEIER